VLNSIDLKENIIYICHSILEKYCGNMNERYKNWSITKGDYQKDIDHPQNYHHGYINWKKLSKVTKVAIGVGVTIILLSIIIAAIIN